MKVLHLDFVQDRLCSLNNSDFPAQTVKGGEKKKTETFLSPSIQI